MYRVLLRRFSLKQVHVPERRPPGPRQCCTAREDHRRLAPARNFGRSYTDLPFREGNPTSTSTIQRVHPPNYEAALLAPVARDILWITSSLAEYEHRGHNAA